MLKFAIRSLACLAAMTGSGPSPVNAADVSHFSLPDGFEIEVAAQPPLVKYPMQGAFDERGRLFLCESAGLNMKEAGLLEKLPNFIRLIEDTDHDGVFDKSTIFADKMTFPAGVLWHRGALYVASPPYIWKFTDSNDDGVADSRTKLVGKFRSLGHAGDIHGPFLAPDGRLVITDAPLGHEIHDRDGNLVSRGTAARVFICDTDGQNLETFCGGGTFNPVEVAFTPEGEMLGIMTWYNPDKARHDALVHYVYGGVYPKRVEAWINEFQRTGPLMPAIKRYGVVAPSSIIRYHSSQFGAGFSDGYFVSYFNTRAIKHIRLNRSGATFTADETNFLRSSNPDFRPCEVIEDADGSLLVIDTGGWFINGCPSSRIGKPEITGGIYRIRKTGAHHTADWRGHRIDWERQDVALLTSLLGDDRPAVRLRALDTLALRGADAVEPLGSLINDPTSPPDRRIQGIFALSRMGSVAAKQAIRTALGDTDRGVRLAALRCVGRERDAKALADVLQILAVGNLAEQREAASALGRIASAEAVPLLLDKLATAPDRFLEHALIFALIEINAAAPTAAGLHSALAPIRRGTLIALDQMNAQAITMEQVSALLADPDEPVRDLAVNILSKNPEWSQSIVATLDQWFTEINAGAAPPNELPRLLAAFIDSASIQESLAKRLPQGAIRADNPLLDLALEAMAANRRLRIDATLPSSLLSYALRGIRNPLRTATAIRVLERHGAEPYLEDLRRLGDDTKQNRVVRLRVAEALSHAQASPISDSLCAFLINEASSTDNLTRLQALRLLGDLAHTGAQRHRILPLMATAGPLELRSLLPAFTGDSDELRGLWLVKLLVLAPGATGLSVADWTALVSKYPPSVQDAAAPLMTKLNRQTESQAERLAELAPVLVGGNPDLGKEVFFSTRATCSVCHRIGRFGGTLGPDLSNIGQVRSRKDLLEAIVFPNASFARGYEPVQINTHGGDTLVGTIREDNVDEIVLGLPDGSIRRIERRSVSATQWIDVSTMPTGLDQVLSPDELRALLAYLQSLSDDG